MHWKERFPTESGRMVSEVRVRSAVMAASWAHALSTEAEEVRGGVGRRPLNLTCAQVMGLYLGKVEGDVLAILSLTPIRRTTKQKDRVSFPVVKFSRGFIV